MRHQAKARKTRCIVLTVALGSGMLIFRALAPGLRVAACAAIALFPWEIDVHPFGLLHIKIESSKALAKGGDSGSDGGGNSGPGGGDDGDSDGDDGDGDDGDGDDSGGDDGDDGDGDDSDHSDGSDDNESDGRSRGAGSGGGEADTAAVTVEKVMIVRGGVQIHLSDGGREEIRNGRFERFNARGQKIESRRARGSDAARVGALAGRVEFQDASDQADNTASAVLVTIRGRDIDVLFSNGWRERITGGKYTMTDQYGRAVVSRRATRDDRERLRHYRK